MGLCKQSLAFLALILCPLSALAQWVDPEEPFRNSLKGLKTIVVAASVGTADALPDDPTEREIQESVEKRFTVAGIHVLKRPYGTTDNFPTFTAEVQFRNFDIFYYQLSVRLALIQSVTVDANPSLKLKAATWSWWSGGVSGMIAGSSKRSEIAEVVDHFICEFRTANPEIKGPIPDCERSSSLSWESDEEPAKPAPIMSELQDDLIRAAAWNNLAEVSALLAKGADVDTRGPSDATPLYYAVRTYNRNSNDAGVIDELLKRGANPNLSPSCRLTPLMIAVSRDDVKIAQALLEHGADVNAATPEGFTALMSASMVGYPEAVALLIKRGANINAQTRNGQTSLTLARKYRNRIRSEDWYPVVNAPYMNRTEADMLKIAQEAHDQVIQTLKQAGAKPGPKPRSVHHKEVK